MYLHLYSYLYLPLFFWGSVTSDDIKLLEIINDSDHSGDESTLESRNAGENHKALVSNSVFHVFCFISYKLVCFSFFSYFKIN